MDINQYKQILIYDHPHTLHEHMDVDSILLEQCLADDLIVRFWTSNGVVFGKLDTILKNFEEGKQYLTGQGIDTTIRKSGGLAVFLDDQTLNISLIISKRNSKIDINEGYKRTVDMLSDFLKKYDVKMYNEEISNSYCPGKYDCVIDGFKFCGIAQFQKKYHAVIMLNMVVAGDQRRRLGHIKNFYSLSNTANSSVYPTIHMSSMKTLSELTQLDLSCAQVINDFKEYLSSHDNVRTLDKIQISENNI